MPTATEIDVTTTPLESPDGQRSTHSAWRSLGHVPALDGLRGLAVLAVVLYHLPASWLPGGFLGVDVFFVLSGFLITSLLLREQQGAGVIGLRGFWRRRIRRLFPAAAAMVLTTTLLASIFAKDAMGRLRSDVPASLAYVMNWRLIFHHDSYEQAFGRPPLLEHLWSLGVEEQFYLAWPLVVVAVAWLLRRRASGSDVAADRSAESQRVLGRAVGAVATGGALASALLMAVLVHPGSNPSAVYFDPVTHACGLLLGAASAAAFPLWRRSSAIRPNARRLLEVLATAAAAGLVALLLILQQGSTSTYRGGLQLASLLSAVIVVVAGHPAARLRKPLGARSLVWLGRRSYSIYLWHWPIFEMTRPGIDLRIGAVPTLIVRLSLTLLAADLSYRWVEQPWRTGRAQRGLAAWWRLAAKPVLVTGVGVVGVLGMSVAVLLVDAPTEAPLALTSSPASRDTLLSPPAGGSTIRLGPGEPSLIMEVLRRAGEGLLAPSGRATLSPTSSEGRSMSLAGGPSSTAGGAGSTAGGAGSTAGGAGSTAGGPGSTAGGASSTAGGASSTAGISSATVPGGAPGSVGHSQSVHAGALPPGAALSGPVLAIGDSVLLGATDQLTAALGPGTIVDAVVGRQVAQGLQRVAEYRAAGRLAGLGALVVALGTNGPMSVDQCHQFISLAAGDRVVFVTVRVPRPWQDITNASIAACAAGSPGVVTADWFGASAAAGVLGPDQVHETVAGRSVYASVVVAAVKG